MIAWVHDASRLCRNLDFRQKATFFQTVLNKEILEGAIAQKNRNGIDYAEILSKLDEAGVRSYKVEVPTKTLVYSAGENKESYEEKDWNDGQVLEVAPDYNEAHLKDVLARAERKDIDFPTFLKEIGQAGILYYLVDVPSKTIRYVGNGGSYQSTVPALQQKDKR